MTVPRTARSLISLLELISRTRSTSCVSQCQNIAVAHMVTEVVVEPGRVCHRLLMHASSRSAQHRYVRCGTNMWRCCFDPAGAPRLSPRTVYAGYQFKYAQLEDTAGNSPFNACQYALGFGAHVAADYAGFYPGGYLGNGHSPNGATWRNWISLWPFMTVVDAYVARNWTMSLPHLPTSPLSSAGAAFIADATAYSGKQGQQFPVLSPSEVLNCTTTWSETVNRNVDVAGNYLACVHAP